MPSKRELENLIKDCMDKKGWSYDRCKRYIAGGIWGGEDEQSQEDDMKTYSIQAVPILKAGNFTDMNGVNVRFTIEDLDEIVRNTNALLKSKLLEPPLKLGHNEEQKLIDGLPAIGYVSQVYRLGNQLFADFTNVPEKIYKLINKKAYSKISSEVYLDFKHPETGEKIGKTLRAVALLGADLPAIKGLGDILSLYNSENNQSTYTLCFSESELINKNDMEVKMNKWNIDNIKDVIKCDACIEVIKKFMEEDKKTEITTEELAIYLTKMRMMKLEETMNEKKDAEIICPDGFEWNGVECISKNKEEKIDGHICPKGYKWDETQNKCVSIEVVEEEIKKDEKNKDDKKDLPTKDEIKSIMKDKEKEIKEFKFVDDKRPPKGWWDRCISEVSDITDTPEQLCGWIYYHWMSPERKQEIESTRQKEEVKMSETEQKIIELQEKVKEFTVKEYKNKLDEMKNKNRDILIPALDNYLDGLFNYFIENDDKVIKFSDNKTENALDVFFRFLNRIVNAKRVIFSELSKNENDYQSIMLGEDTIVDGNVVIKNVRLAKLARAIKEKENITYDEALTKAYKIINNK